MREAQNVVTQEMQIRVLKRQLTCALKRNSFLVRRAAEVTRGKNVLRWARMLVIHQSD